MTSFLDLGLKQSLVDACTELKWITPTEIQTAAIPVALEGKNLIGLAETGSGKTAAYALPILQKLMENPHYYFAIILAPTRELASQVQAHFTSLGKLIGLNSVLLIGGTPILEQAKQMSQKIPHVIVATPGRFIDHLKRTKGFDEFRLKNVKFLVIDETDRMLGSDFDTVIEKILIVLPPQRQTLLFSATMTDKINKLQRLSMRDPVRITLKKNKFQTVDSLRQYVHLVPQKELEGYLICILRIAFSQQPAIPGLEAIRLTENFTSPQTEVDTNLQYAALGSAIVFTRTRDTSNCLSLLLRQFLTIPIITLNGDMPHAQRLGALLKFRRCSAAVLVATDLASRGLDIPQVGLVLNFDVPLDAKTYIHRVGRTARAGRSGCALTLLSQHSVLFYIQEIESRFLAGPGALKGRLPALVTPNSTLDANLEAAVAELLPEVGAALVLAKKTVEGLKKRGHGRPGAFVSVDDMKTPSTAEIALPPGMKRTAWAIEASEETRRQISNVLSVVSTGEGRDLDEDDDDGERRRTKAAIAKRKPKFRRGDRRSSKGNQGSHKRRRFN